MAARDPEMRTMACVAIKDLLRSDVDGGVALEAVQLIADLVKTRKCDCHPEVVRTLAVLTFSEVRREEPGEEVKTRKQQRKDEVKLLKKPGKKAQKVAKLGLGGMPTNVAEAIKAQAAASKAIAKGVKKDLKLSDANVDTRLRATRQSKMLEALFEIYFRVLKHCVAFGANLLAQESKKGPQDPSNEPASVPAPGLGWSRERFMRRFPLLYPALEGLARYTHLISVEYFNDLMEGFKDLLRSPALPLEDRFRLLLTASDILRGQGEALTIDRKDFYIKLYEAIGLVPYRQLGVDEEYDDDESAPGRGGPSSSDQGSVDLSGQESLSVLLASTLQQMLCDTKISDIARVAAFLKRSASISLVCGSSEAIVFLGVIMRLLRRYPRLLTMLEFEGEAPVGGRMFDHMCHDPSEAGAMGASLWELSVLTRSSHPHLAQAAASLLSMKPEGAQAQGMTLTGPLALAGTAKDLALAYDSSRGSFNPAPHAPKAVKLSGSSVRRLQQAAKKDSSHEMTEQMLGGVPKIGSSSKISRSLLTFYTINKRFQVNSELRREKVLLLEKLNRFKRHLIEAKKQ
jgi:nucleolar complex protein 3